MKKNRLLIIHPFLWTHYKATIYSELQQVFDKDPDAELLVLQVALNEKNRANLGNIDWDLHKYNLQLLFDDFVENTTVWQRFIKVCKWINKFKPTVINLPGYYDNALNLALIYCKIKGIKVILSIDSTENDTEQRSWKDSIKKWFVSQSSGFFCYGTKSTELMLKLGAKSNQILMKNNAVDNDSISKIHKKTLENRGKVKNELGLRKYNFTYVGRLIEVKNIERLFEAYKKVQNENWGLICLGDGNEKDNLVSFAKSNELSGVKFIDGQNWQKIPEFLALADVFILPSYSEPWGLVVNEAMACEMPVLVSNRCGSAIDLVENNMNGFTFDPYSVDDLIEKMNYFIDNPNQIVQFGLYSKNKIKNYSPQIVAKEMYDGFLKVL